MDFEALVTEATHVINSLWPLDATCELAELGVPVTLPDGETVIVSTNDGEVLWRAGRILPLPWAFAFLAAARNISQQTTGAEHEERRLSLQGG